MVLQRSELLAAPRPPGHSLSRPLLQVRFLDRDPDPQDVEQDDQLLQEFHAVNNKRYGLKISKRK